MKMQKIVWPVLICILVNIPDSYAADSSLATPVNRFGFRLFKQVLSPADINTNVFISPLSISYALGMAYNGAAGTTRQALASTLELSGLTLEQANRSYRDLMMRLKSEDPAVKFNIANSIWYRQGLPISQDFIMTNQTNFDAVMRGLDFNSPSAADIINDWVNENTKGKIDKIIAPPIDPLTIMYLINAVYFKGIWTTTFDSADTRKMPFHLYDGGETICKMMFRDTTYDYFEDDLFHAVGIPYGKEKFSMIVLLPKPAGTVEDLIDNLDSTTWDKWRQRFEKVPLTLGLPKFKFKYEIILNEALRSLGMSIAFDASAADFSGMIKGGQQSDRIRIDEVRHKTFVQVDEEGTEAAAVTSVTMALTAFQPSPRVIVDRPFLFFVNDNETGAILFVGKVANPIWEKE